MCRWAYEHKNEEAIELLQAAGIDENAKDRGKAPPLVVPRTCKPRSQAAVPADPCRAGCGTCRRQDGG